MYTLFSFNVLYPEKSENKMQFILYIISGNSEEVLNYINDKKVNISAKVEDGMTPLMFSIIYKQKVLNNNLLLLLCFYFFIITYFLYYI